MKLVLLSVFGGADTNVVRILLERAACQKRMTLCQFYRRQYDKVCEYFVKELCQQVENWTEQGQRDGVTEEDGEVSQSIRIAMGRLAGAFGFCQANANGTEDWLRISLRHLIPWLVLAKSDAASRIHKCIAVALNTNRHNLLADNFQYILVRVVVEETEDDVRANEIWKFLVSEGGGTLDWAGRWPVSDTPFPATEYFSCFSGSSCLLLL